MARRTSGSVVDATAAPLLQSCPAQHAKVLCKDGSWDRTGRFVHHSPDKLAGAARALALLLEILS